VHDSFSKTAMWRYVFFDAWRFTLRIQPNIVTKTKVKDFNLERRQSEIKMYLEKNDLYPRMLKIMNGNYQWKHRAIYGDLEKYQDPFKNKSIEWILEEYSPSSMDQQISPRPTQGFSFVTYSSFFRFFAQDVIFAFINMFHPLNRGI